MNIEMLRAKLREVVAQARALVDDYESRNVVEFSKEDQEKYDALRTEGEELRSQIETLEKREADILSMHRATEGVQARTSPETKHKRNLYDVRSITYDTSASQLRGRAQQAIEADEVLPDNCKEAAIKTLRSVDRRGEVAMLMLATGHPAYRSGWAKVMSGSSFLINDEEREVMARAQAIGSNASGGYAVPFTLDPTVIWTDEIPINPMRQVATIKRTTTNEWNGVTSDGATAHWRGEAEEVDDDSIDLGQPNIPTNRMDIFVPYSIEIEMDWDQMESEIRIAMARAKDKKEAVGFTTGTGTNDQPTGFVTALTGTASEVDSATAEVFAIGDVYGLRRSLPAMYRSASAWMAAIGTYDAVRQFDTSGGGGFWTDMMDGTPDRLLGRSVYENSSMDDAADIDASATDTHRILTIGDWSNFYIVDRLGMRTEMVPHLFGTQNNRPTGERGIVAFARVGSDVVVDNAFRMLKITTTA